MTHLNVTGVRSSMDALDLRAVARDLWPGGTLDMWQGRRAPTADAVFWPESDEQVLAVLKAASKSGVPVVPYGAGSGVCGGARGRPGSVARLECMALLERCAPMQHEGLVAQWIRHRPTEPGIAGSSPAEVIRV